MLGRIFTRLVRAGMRKGWQRGVKRGERAWVVVGGLALIGHLAGRAWAHRERVVVRERIRPGEVLQVTHSPRT